MTDVLDGSSPGRLGVAGVGSVGGARRGPRLGRLATAMVIDAFGSGLFGPFGLLYAHVVVGLPLVTAGAALAVVGLVALVLGPVAGALVDRFSAARVAAAGNALAAVGAGVLLLARDLPLFVVGAFLGTVAVRVFWAAFAPLVGDAVPVAAREKWFGLLRGSRYAGMAAGGLLASAVLLLGEQRGLLVMLALDGASYLLAAVLITAARITPTGTAASRQPGAAPAPATGYRTALRDRTNLVLVALNVMATLLITAPVIAMPVFVLSVLQQPAWLPGALAGVGTAALAIGVSVVHRVTAHRGRLRVLAVASVVWMLGALAYAAAPTVPVQLTVAVLFLASVGIGLGEALYGPTADTLPLVIAPPGMAGRYTALHQVAWGISGSIAPALVGALITGPPALLWLVLAGVAGCTAAAYRLLPPAAHHRAATVGSTAPADTAPAHTALADTSPVHTPPADTAAGDPHTRGSGPTSPRQAS